MTGAGSGADESPKFLEGEQTWNNGSKSRSKPVPTFQQVIAAIPLFYWRAGEDSNPRPLDS